MKFILGGKGAGLADMTGAGLPVPPSFTITTEACVEYMNTGEFPPGMWEQTLEALEEIERRTGRRFGDPENPLLVSVRSGARVSMPGMMDTVLNLGLNDDTVQSMAQLTGNGRFVWDAYRRLVQMFGNIGRGIDRHKFEAILDEYKAKTEGGGDIDLTVEMLKEVTADFKALYEEALGEEFPDDPYEQLRQAIGAVFGSWLGAPAVSYRNAEGIPHDWGTAVNVQTMVFGNMGWDSGSGVAFTRSPATGERTVYGEYLLNAQGEDVVAGIRTPYPIADMEKRLPEIYQQFREICDLLERHYRDVQDVEFTIERGKLWMLQTRTGKRTAAAAVKIAVDMVDEGLITKEEALMRVTPAQVDQFLHPRFDPEAKQNAKDRGDLLAEGLNASPGAATGAAIFDADRAEERSAAGEPVILVRPETNPDDVHGMEKAKGVLTHRGGMTSPAAVVARGWGKPCVAGCEAIRIDLDARQFTANERKIREGDVISIDGATGEVFAGSLATIEPRFEEEHDLITLLGWADEFRTLGVRANADCGKDAKKARQLGAEGIGLARTEHQFFDERARDAVVRMIMAETDEERQAALDEMLPFQEQDFEGLFEAMDGLPVVMRLLDPPMHEFLPPKEELIEEVTRLRCTNEDPERLQEAEKILRVVEDLWETNPMMGLRGCRAGILYKGLTEMQVRAFFKAACACAKRGRDIEVHPEVMIPLVSHVNELRLEREKLERVAKQIIAEEGLEGEIDYKFGTMIEVPRAALTADEIARYAQFFSFGTNDLHQFVLGISRDDAEGKFLMQYVDGVDTGKVDEGGKPVRVKILEANPFQTIDQAGVGRLMKICVEEGRAANPGLETGICGEHGGDPASIDFCHRIGLDYVSCSPYRVPVARLAAAQAALRHASDN
ncbi:MAG: pyruvate, phosphate dikinase, partial [Chloroflexi bacterium]|nr:pyruvate, phosphate dikinase [Chloroflexota bacterium]